MAKFSGTFAVKPHHTLVYFRFPAAVRKNFCLKKLQRTPRLDNFFGFRRCFSAEYLRILKKNKKGIKLAALERVLMILQ